MSKCWVYRFFCSFYGNPELSDSSEYSLIIGLHRLDFCHHVFDLQPEFLQEWRN